MDIYTVNFLKDKRVMANGKNYHHGNLKEALINAGLSILTEQGLAALSLRKCAEIVGVSPMAPKNHFGNMAGLLTAIASHGYGALLEAVRRAMDQAVDRPGRRDAALTAYVAFARNHPALYELMFSNRQINKQDPELQAQLAACFQILSEMASGLDWDKAGEPDARLRGQIMFWSLAHGFAQLVLSGKLEKATTNHLDILEIAPSFPYRD